MAVNRQSERSASALDSLKWRVLPACLAGALLIVGVNLLAGWLVDGNAHKVAANQIVSPWDKARIPPVLRTSHVAARVESVEPRVAETPEKRHGIKHRSARRYHLRKQSSHNTTREQRSMGYPSL
jgi:hypothetical protein